MTAGTDHLRSLATFWVVAINGAALIAFMVSPGAREHPLAVVGILAFLAVQACLPACRLQTTAPLCPANVAQGYFWIQLVLVTVLIGYYGPTQGSLPYLPSKRAIDLAIVIYVVGYLSFCAAYQWRSRPSEAPGPREGSAPGSAYLIVPFAVVGLAGFLLAHGGVAGFGEYLSSPIEQRLRAEDPTTLPAAAGSFLKHFLGFAVVLAWSWWLGRAPRRRGPIVAVTAGVVIALLIVNFNYNRGTMLGPLVGLAAAFSMHAWRVPFKGVVLAGGLALSLAFAFGSYRASELDIHELSVSALAETWDSEGVVDFVQMYALAPQMSAYLIESLEGTFYYGKTLLPSLVYPVPVLGKPYREVSGPVIFNELIYGETDTLDQIIPLAGELYVNLHLLGVVLGYGLLGVLLAWLQGKFMAAPNPVESYAWLMIALWTAFPGSLSVGSQIYVYSFWPIYTYFAVKSLRSWNSAMARHRDQAASEA